MRKYEKTIIFLKYNVLNEKMEHTSQACHAKAMRKACENHAKNQRRAEKNEEHGRPLKVHGHRSLDR